MWKNLSPDPGEAPYRLDRDSSKHVCRSQASEQRREPALVQISHPKSKNHLLATLSHGPVSALRPHLQRMILARGSVLCEANDSMRLVYFLESGLAALVTQDRAPAVLATVGREGGVGGSTLLLGGGIAFGRYQMLIDGSALAIEEARLRIALRDHPILRSVCEAYTKTFLLQVMENLACNSLHTAEQRCARWLLMCGDLIEDDTFQFPEENLSAMLCVPQLEADAIASRLRAAGLIRLHEGFITILDRRKLEAVACVCYLRSYEHYGGLLGSVCT